MKPRIIHAHCHGCSTPLVFEAVTATITEITGERKTFDGKDSAAWICETCRKDTSKLVAARLAAGLPAVPKLSRFEDDEEEVAEEVVA